MQNIIDELKVKIEKARKELPTESVEAIDFVNWKPIIAGMTEKYSPDQLENLTTETELLLCGLLTPEQYQKEIELRMRISKNESTSLLSEMDKLIFKKIQNELERILAIKDKALKNKSMILDQKFSNTPKEVQQAIATSSWKESLYSISKKYKLPIDKMGILEDITAKVINGGIETNKLEIELKNNLGLPENDNHNLVEEINTKILKVIKETLKENWGDGKKTEEDTVPLPPYLPQAIKISKTEQAPIEMEPTSEEKNGNVDIYKNSGIELLDEEKPDISLKDIEISKPKSTTPIIEAPIILDEKGEETKKIIENIKTEVEKVETPNEFKTATKNIETISINNQTKTPEAIAPVAPIFATPKIASEINENIIKEEKPEFIIPSIKLTPLVKKDEMPTPSTVEIKKEAPIETPKKINILQMKLNDTVASENTVSDYSIPKINSKIDQVPTPPTGYTQTPHDSYREEI